MLTLGTTVIASVVETCERKGAEIVLKMGGLGVHQPFPFGEDKLDEESKTSLNVPFELAFTPIKMN